MSTLAVVVALSLLGPSSPDLTSKQALDAAQRFLIAAKLPPPVRPLTARWSHPRDMNGSWEINDNGNYRIAIGEGSSKVTSFINEGRQYEISRKINRTGKRRFANAKAARAYVIALAKDLGFPMSANPTIFKYGTQFGEIYSQWVDKPFGYPGLNASYVALDMQDGVMKSYSARWNVRTSKPSVKISKATAERTAEKAYYAGRMRRFNGGPLNPKATKIRWVIPNSDYTSNPYRPPQVSPVARLAYEVFFGYNSVWVDAETGEVIGGLTSK